jgi:Putative DNA-binding domain
MTLAETQALLHEAITSRAEIAPQLIERCVASARTLSNFESVEIYANMYLWRLVDALRETFPNLTRYLGDVVFAALARDYVRCNPSEHHDVGRIGRRLPAFLREHPDLERPVLADLAELEWARNEVFFAPLADPVGPEVLAGLGPDDLSRSRLLLSPALRVLAPDHAVAGLWRQLEDGERPAPAIVQASPLAVWRSGFSVHHCALSLDEAVALRRAERGEGLAQVCAAFEDREDPAAAASGAIASWFAEGWLVGLEAPGDTANVLCSVT